MREFGDDADLRSDGLKVYVESFESTRKIHSVDPVIADELVLGPDEKYVLTAAQPIENKVLE